MNDGPKYICCLSSVFLFACQMQEETSTIQSSIVQEELISEESSIRESEEIEPVDLSDRNFVSEMLDDQLTYFLISKPWRFSGNDKPYPVLKDNSYFLMGDGYKSEASYLLIQSGGIAKDATLSFRFKIDVVSGKPDFVAMETGNAPNSGTIGIVVVRNYNDEHGRFWFKKRINLDPGTYTITAPVGDLVNWSNVNGRGANSVTRNFHETLSKVKEIGVTFGGGNHFGHGVRVFGGNAKFTILSMGISRP